MDVPQGLGNALWPVSRFIGFRPEKIRKEDAADDPESRGRLLPQNIHQHPSFGRHSRALARFRENKVVQQLGHLVWTFIGSFFGTALIATMSRAHIFRYRDAPIVIGSFGAEAVLLYAAHTVPLCQPRNVIGGNAISAVIGVALAKGFVQLPGFEIGQVGYANWAVASLAIACAILAMQISGTTHPPGGATALLAVTIPAVYNLNWFYVADIVASSCVMLGWALIVNNLGHRRYPQYWISPKVAKKVNPEESNGK